VFQSANDHHSGERILSLVKDAGLHTASPIQRQLFPELPSEKDLLIEAGDEEGKALALLFPALIRNERPARELYALILTADRTKLLRSDILLRKLTSKQFKGQQFAVLGTESQAKKELRLISRRLNIIVGTPERIIDHLRRGNLDLSSLSTLVLDVPDEPHREGFEQDAEFILSKIPSRIQTVIFAPHPEKLEFLAAFQRRSTSLTRAQREDYLLHMQLYTCSRNKAEAAARILLGRGRVKNCLLICENNEEAQTLRRLLQVSGVDGQADACIISGGSTENIPMQGINTILFAGILPEIGTIKKLVADTGKDPAEVELLTVCDTDNAECLKTLTTMEEARIMSLEEKAMPSNQEVLKGHIENILNTIKIDEDPEILNSYRSLLRKHVPFFMRSYFAAYLLKESGAKLNLPNEKEKSDRRRKEKMKTLFVSIGKNRKVYPKDLVYLFRSTLSLEKAEIGSVKVLDNYSFVEISELRSQEAISKMDGMEYRGRKITVNYSRKK
jgi:ATP-dependent RNA helicase DeaD